MQVVTGDNSERMSSFFFFFTVNTFIVEVQLSYNHVRFRSTAQ